MECPRCTIKKDRYIDNTVETEMERILVYGMTKNPGGIESYLLGMSSKIKKYDIQFDFVSDFSSIAYADELKQNGSRLYFIPAKGKKLLQHLGAVRKLLKNHPEYKIVYFNILDAGAAFTAAVPWLMGRRIVVHSHNGSTEKVRLHRMCRPFLNLMADQRAACSRVAAEYMFGRRQQNRKPAVIVPNAIRADRYYFNEAVRAEYRENLGLEDRLVICHVGRITEQKNPFRLIDIFDTLCEMEPKAELLYIGTGELEEQVKAYVKKKKCADKVRFLGIRSDVAELMQASDVFLLPSLYEGLPIVAVEAQAAGLPVVLSSNITDETDITGNLSFVDLEKSDVQWAEAISGYKNFKREDCRIQIQRAGYDLESSENEKILVECFR